MVIRNDNGEELKAFLCPDKSTIAEELNKVPIHLFSDIPRWCL